MIKRIIVEGADQQGKTTLCRILSDRLGWEVKHFGKPANDFNFIADYVIPENTISDRNFLSEVIYSRINNSKCRAQFMLLNNIFKNNDTLLILCDREGYFVFDTKRYEDYSYEAIQMAINLYRQTYELVSFDKLIVNPNHDNFAGTVEHIIAQINENI